MNSGGGQKNVRRQNCQKEDGRPLTPPSTPPKSGKGKESKQTDKNIEG